MAQPLSSVLRVVEFSVEECPKAPNSGPALFSFEQFHGLCAKESVEQETEVWYGDGTRPLDFYVVSDIWNYWYRWIRVETQLRRINLPCWRN